MTFLANFSDSHFDVKKIRLIMHLRKLGINDTAVLSAVERIPRHAFVDPTMLDKAYDDIALPIGRGQTISQPSVVAMMTQALKVNDRMKVLEIGTGSGYQAAILAKLCRRVYSIERHDELYRGASGILDELKIRNITLKCGDGLKGWSEQKPFDRIIITAAATGKPPYELIEQLAVGGVMVAPIGSTTDDQMVVRFTKHEQVLEAEPLFPVRFVPLLPDIQRNNTARQAVQESQQEEIHYNPHQEVVYS